MADRRAQLEAGLRANWSLDELAVYADQLLADGDPRGELIALDLRAAEDSPTSELLQRRRVLLATWIGKKLAAAAGDRIKHGFIDVLDANTESGEEDDSYAQLIASPAGEFVRELRVRGSPALVQAALKRLTWQPRPWLAKLTITVDRPSEFVGRKLADELVQATPWLEELHLSGRRVILGFSHPTLRRLRVSGFDALGALGGASRDVLPAVTHLDLALCAETGDHQTTRRVAALTLDQLPSLTYLDLSRNQAGNRAPIHLAGGGDVFAILGDASVRSRITHLRMPSLRSREAVDALREALGGMPALVAVEIARAHRGMPLPFELAHARVPVSLVRTDPWPAADERDGYLSITLPEVRSYFNATLQLAELCEFFDARFASFPLGARAAWVELLGFLDELAWLDDRGNPISRPFPMATFDAALSALDDLRPGRALRERLHAVRSTTVILWRR